MLELPIHGRGASDNPGNRFESIHYEPDDEANPEDRPAPATLFFRDITRSIIATNDSPDIHFETSINPYRGCEHGCIYCYARPYHEYLGFSAGLDFETRILVKEDAPALLRKELTSPKWQPQMIAISGVTDPYQPIERRMCITRGCLQVLAEFRNPVGIVTKSRLVTRDADILGEMASWQGAMVYVAVTSLDNELAGLMEPRASRPAGRLEAMRELAKAGIPVGVLTAPIIPGLNDHEVPAILEAAYDAGARSAGMTLLRLPHGVSELFQTWLEQHFPDRKDKVLGRVRAIRGGKLNDPNFNTRMRGEGPIADSIRAMFHLARNKLGMHDRPKLSTKSFRRVGETPTALFAE